ncbi:hypothetical protein EMPS_03925 [Entomortierella parvispora]|uniref:Actin-like ATPase domain-containing protein n=1 Tax=Entomortierella parvispora TaxID=205924 RepID=A0A9P3LVB6_9FUNG|nr:hypothetical protein EMPS_03925 [Entomortierella parvispora]
MPLSTLDLDEFPVVVAIDFGTTFSPKQLMYYAKTPTVSLYKKTNNKYKMESWGCDSKLKKGRSGSECFLLYKYKTQLDESADLPPWSSPISVPDAISDFLRALHEYVAGKIEQELGKRFTRDSFRYCLTVPAMWSDKAKDTMRQAAIRAGLVKTSDHMDRLMLVTEPEAAALYCERSCKEYDLKHGDRFLICDAGGGTVDLIVYDISETAKGRSLSEVTKGHGASCGSMLIDQNFGKLLAQKFTEQGASVRNDDDVISNLVEKFAFALKPQFNGVDDLYLELPWNSFFEDIEFPDAIGIDEDVMRFTAVELKKLVFDPVVEQVLELIQGQLDKAKDCSAIFMVGGFGSSTYLLERVMQEFGNSIKTISAPNRPEIAVVFGAVYAALSPGKVTARATRRCYGVEVNRNFEVGVDPTELMVRRVDGVKCRDRFSTIVKKGTVVKVDECIDGAYYFTHQGGIPTGDMQVSIYSIDGDPPRYVTKLSPSAHILIPNPFTTSDPPGREVHFIVKFYFGLSEIRAETTIKGNVYSTRLKFDAVELDDSSNQSLFQKDREY